MEIPPARDTDAEDVVWGLQTADALWKRGERIDALVWLRRAAQAAGDANDDDRALELARNAAELTDWMASQAQVATVVPQEAVPQAPSSQSIDVDLSTTESARQLPHFPTSGAPAPPPASARPFPPQSRPPSQPTIQTPDAVFTPDTEEPTQTNDPRYAPEPPPDLRVIARDDAESVLPAEKVHAGMFDPWADQAANMPAAAPRFAEAPPAPLAPPSQPPVVATLPSVPPDAVVEEEEEEEVVTSLRPASLQQPGRSELAPALGPKPPPRKPPPLPPRALQKPPVPRVPTAPLPPRPATPSAPRIPSRAPAPPPPSSSRLPPAASVASSPQATLPRASPPTPARPPPSHPMEEVALPSSAPVEQPAPDVAPPTSEAEDSLIAAPRPMTEPEPPPEVTPTPFEPVMHAPSERMTPAPASPTMTKVAPPPSAPAPAAANGAARLELEGIDPFGDLPDDAREEFARVAKVSEVAEGEEVSGFALAYIIEGSFDVAATVVDAPAVRLGTGAVLRARGTTEEGVPMRLICAQGTGRVATWSNEAVEAAFRTCPWVEDDLRSAADRVQTLVGITIGPLGERLDASIREQIMSRLTLRPLSPSEIVVNAGEVVPGLLLVGVGELELVQGEEVAGTVGSGEFLFPTEVLGAGAAPATARAGAGGALIMFGDRKIAQELLVTCPPLLEVFAGM